MIRPYWSQNAGVVRNSYTLPSELPLSQEYADTVLKSKLNVSDYQIIQDAIAAATDDSERSTSRLYIKREVTAEYDYIYEKVNLTFAPVVSVTSVTVIEPITGVETALTTDDYTVIGGEEPYLIIGDYVGYRLRVVYECGYADYADQLPAWVRDCVLSRLMYKYAMQPMEMAMYERRFTDAETRHRYYVTP